MEVLYNIFIGVTLGVLGGTAGAVLMIFIIEPFESIALIGDAYRWIFCKGNK